VPSLLVETPEDQAVCDQAHARRDLRLKRRADALAEELRRHV